MTGCARLVLGGPVGVLEEVGWGIRSGLVVLD